jgi:enterochelin esterase-like enzyme
MTMFLTRVSLMVARILCRHGGAPAPLREALTFTEPVAGVHVKTCPALLPLLLLVAGSGSVHAAEPPRPTVAAGRIERLTLPADGAVAARPVDVWLPPGYPEDAPYAVALMFDGQMLFDAGTTWNRQEWRADETAAALQAAAKTRPFIIVGVWNPGAARHAEYFPQRPFDALPADVRQGLRDGAKRGEAALFSADVYSDAYLRWIDAALLPDIESRYAVSRAADDRVLIGASMGGLIAMYGVLERPEAFGGFGALSTHWPGIVPQADNPVPAAFFAYLRERLPAPGAHRLYFDHGDATLDAFYPPLQAEADRIAVSKGWAFPGYRSLAFPGAEHSENAWAARLEGVFTFLLPPRGD